MKFPATPESAFDTSAALLTTRVDRLEKSRSKRRVRCVAMPFKGGLRNLHPRDAKPLKSRSEESFLVSITDFLQEFRVDRDENRNDGHRDNRSATIEGVHPMKQRLSAFGTAIACAVVPALALAGYACDTVGGQRGGENRPAAAEAQRGGVEMQVTRGFDPDFFRRSWRMRGKILTVRRVRGTTVLRMNAVRLLSVPKRFRDESRNVAATGARTIVDRTAVITRYNKSARLRVADLKAGDPILVTGRFTKPRRWRPVTDHTRVLTFHATRIQVSRPVSGSVGTQPPPAAVSGGYPSASTAGVPPGTSLHASGAITVTKAGTVIDAMDVSGAIDINASNVTVRRTRITGSEWALISVMDGATGVRIEDVEIDGRGTSGKEGSSGIGGLATVRRTNIHHVENGIVPSSGSVLSDNYIHDLSAPGSPHYDGIQIGEGVNILIQHNTIDLHQHDQTAAVMIVNDFGPVSNIHVDGNRLLGGGYTVYSDGSKSGGPISDVRFTNNRIARGHWGYALIRDNATPATFQNNVDDTTGALIHN